MIRCELNALCGSRYSSFDSYRQHIYRCHRSLIDPFDNDHSGSVAIEKALNDIGGSSVDCISSNEPDLTVDSDEFIHPEEELSEIDYQPINFGPILNNVFDQNTGCTKLTAFYTYFLLEFWEHHLLPQKLVQLIISNICSLLDIIIKITNAKTLSACAPVIDFATVLREINQIISFISKNEYQFLKQCTEHFDYQPPTKIMLNTAEECANYVPLKQSVSCMLHDDQLLQAIIDNIKSLSTCTAKDKDLIISNRQCRSVRSNLVRPTNSNALLLKLYTDGIDITNPIGPKKDSHKLTCFYYLLDDLPEIVRSQVDSIGLHCLCYTKNLNNDNSRRMLMNILVEDLNKLQIEGISIPRLSSRIYFVFSTFCADNLASNEIGGLQKNFNGGHFCRHCFITYENRHIPLTDISFVPRSRLKHDKIVNHIIANNGRQIVQGVKGLSWFHDLIGFHSTESLPPDIMHDIAEGACPLITSALLKEAVQQRLLTHTDIEQSTSNFVYGFYDSSNKPPPIKKQHLTTSYIAGTASQKLCLFQLFPVIFHDIIDHLTLMILYTVLREIISYVYSNPIRKSWISYMNELCKRFHALMVEHLPDLVTPKVHFITEYPRSIEKHGLPILNSCLRFEAKHLYFKQIASRAFNFKNPLLTLAKRYQLRSCLLNKTKSLSLSAVTTIRSSKLIEWCKLSHSIQHLLMKDVNKINTIYECSSIDYHHINIRQGSIVVHHLAHAEEIPVFCQIYCILKVEDKCMIIAEILDTISFNDKLWSYQIELTGTLIKIDIEHCFSIFPHCLDSYVVEQSHYINILTRLTKK
ncbi:unnamed protein product [Rotaria socialis]